MLGTPILHPDVGERAPWARRPLDTIPIIFPRDSRLVLLHEDYFSQKRHCIVSVCTTEKEECSHNETMQCC